MSADAFLVCFGLRWEVDADNDQEIDLLEKRKDPRQLAARTHQLNSWWGNTVDETRFFLLVGRIVGSFGLEGKNSLTIGGSEMPTIMDETRQRLRAAGFEEEPAWHFQFEPDR
jgi:hypothetical protein